MQTVENTIETPENSAPLFLWRAIPAQITVSGVKDPAGEWTFLAGKDWKDEALLAGTVTREGAELVVTLETMDSPSLAEAIRGEEMLSCTAALTDGTSQVYILPVIIRNRIMNAVPTPGHGTEYVRSVNGETGAVILDASDVAAVSIDGLEIVTLENGEIPAPGKVYAFSPTEAAEMTFPAPAEGMTNAFRLRIAMPDPAVAVTWPAGLVWRFSIPTLAAGTTSELAFAWNGANWEGWATPDMSDYMPKSGGNFTGPVGFPMGITMRGDNSQSRIWSCNYGFNIFTGYNSSTLMQNKVIEIKSGYASTDRIDIDPQLGNLRYRGHNENTAGGFCITDATTGGLTIPGDLTFAPAGGTATTLAALIARIEALEQAQN